MNREEDQPLWDLLGKVGEPSLSPFFARNVLREIRQQPQMGWRERVSFWLRPRRLIPATSIALALIAAASVSFHFSMRNAPSPDDPPEVVANIDPQDYEVVADLDDLLASEDDNVWSENESLSL